MAGYEILREWRKGQNNDVEAYTDLWKALTQVQLNRVAHEELKDPPDSFNDGNTTGIIY